MEGTTGTTELLATAARDIAVATAQAALKATLHELTRPILDEDEQGEDGWVVQGASHPGSDAERIDARAITAARKRAKKALQEHKDVLGARVSELVFAGEEGGSWTHELKPKTLIARIDPLDGTTNALTLLQAFSSVVTIDYISPRRGPRHLAGAILGGEFDVSWAHWSRHADGLDRYSRPIGLVYVRTPRLSDRWRKLDVAREQRKVASIAAVASTSKRFQAYAPFRQWALDQNGVAYHTGGNPVCASLLLGHVGLVVETQQVSLHDSAYLIPHWLLDGHVESLKGQEIDYMSLYEAHCLELRPDHKPVPPFVAYSGGRPSDLLSDAQ